MTAAIDETRPTDRPPSKWLFFALWALWAAGLAISGLLLWRTMTHDVSTGGLPGCGVDGADCDAVLLSGYSRVGGVSLTVWAIVYYVVVAGLLAAVRIIGRRPTAPPVALLLPVGSTVGVATGAWAVWAMLLVLERVCPWCAAVHAVNAAFFLAAVVYAAGDWRRWSASRAADGMPAPGRRLVVAAVSAAVLLGGWQSLFLTLFHQGQRLEVRSVTVLDGNMKITRYNVDPLELTRLDEEEPIATFKGNADAPDRLVLFICFTCELCAAENRRLKKILEDYPGRLRIDYRFAPLSPLCNPIHGTKTIREKHRTACAAARAALAVTLVDPASFAPFCDWLYYHQATLNEQAILDEGRRRAGVEPFNRAVQSEEAARRLERDTTLGQRLKMVGVPRRFIAAGEISGEMNATNLEKLLADKFGWPDAAEADHGK